MKQRKRNSSERERKGKELWEQKKKSKLEIKEKGSGRKEEKGNINCITIKNQIMMMCK